MASKAELRNQLEKYKKENALLRLRVMQLENEKRERLEAKPTTHQTGWQTLDDGTQAYYSIHFVEDES